MGKRIIIKVGSKLALAPENRCLAEDVVENIVGQVAELLGKGTEVILVTSGAVATGRCLVPQMQHADSIAEKQVFAAVGQIGLMSLYSRLFERHGFRAAQILVTKEDFRDREHYANMRRCFENLLKENIVPIVNENDVTAIRELFFTDNDELAGLIASQLGADAVIILTSVDGLMAGETVIPEVNDENAEESAKHIDASLSTTGRGGMRRKFEIARRLVAEGIAVTIANGARPHVLTDIAEGKRIGTTFVPDKKLSSTKRRLAHADGFAAGAAYVNEGAEEILLSQKPISILPIGITKVTGTFEKGDVVEVRSKNGKRLGFGIAQYGSDKAAEAIGKKGGRPLIHRDYLFIG